MKKHYLITIMLSLAVLVSSSLMATNYIVSGAGTAAVNGTYVENETLNEKPKYEYISGATTYYLYVASSMYGSSWVISDVLNATYNYSDIYYSISSNDLTPPQSGWSKAGKGVDPVPVVNLSYNLIYQPETFIESINNDGTIENTITVTFIGPGADSFTGTNGDDFVSDNKVVVTNLPSGLTAVITRNSDVELSASLTGNALSHITDVTNLTFAFQNTAFINGNASAVNNSTKSDLVVNFRNQIEVASSGGDYTTIAAAIAAAGSGDIINISAETFTETSQLLISNKDLIVQGQGAGSTIVQADELPNTADHNVFSINANTSVTIKDLTIRNGKYPNGAGGGIHCSQVNELKIINTEISNNYAMTGGGGIFQYDGTLIIENTTICDNVAFSDDGGGIMSVSEATLTITNSTITGNSCASGYHGGAIYSEKYYGKDFCNLTIANSTITNNTKGIYCKNNTLTISNTIIADNSTYDYLADAGITLTDNGGNIIETQTKGGTPSNWYFNQTTDILYSHDYLGNTEGSWNRNNAPIAGSLNISSTLADNNTLNGTQTLALSSPSFAIDNGTGTGNDQRGVPLYNGTKDIGAYEVNDTWVAWQGGTSTNWGTSANWSSGSVPGTTADIGIQQNCTYNPTLASAITCNTLSLSENAGLTIAYNGALTTSSDLVNEGTLSIESSASGTGSLIIEGTLTNYGTMTAQRYIAGWSDAAHGWHYLSSPVASQAISAFHTAGSGNDFYKWDETTGYWINRTASGGGLNGDFETNFVVGRGYLVANSSTSTKTFSGTFNNANVSVSGLTKTAELNYSGWNLIGNPFPCALDWGVGSWSLSNVDANCQVWNEASASYTVVSSGGDIPSMNGFMVHASVNGASLTLPTDAKVHSSTNWYKNSQQYENGIVLRANDPLGQTAQTSIVRFNSEATPGYDTRYDSYFLAGYAPLFYSIAESENYALNTLPEQTEEQVIPMGFVKDGSNGFYIELIENSTGSTVYITDIKTNTTQNLTHNPIYAFTAETGDDPNRFLLHFKAVGVEETTPDQLILVWKQNNLLYLKGAENYHEAGLFDLQGRLLQRTTLSGDDLQTMPSPEQTGMYVIRLLGENHTVSKKLIIK